MRKNSATKHFFAFYALQEVRILLLFTALEGWLSGRKHRS